MKITFLVLLSVLMLTRTCYSQSNRADSLVSIEQLNADILSIRTDIENIQLNLGKSERRFKSGILVSTIGYSITIAGGLMLGRKQDDLGKVLLVTGGVTGVTGTFMMVDAFKYLGRASRRKLH